MPVAVLAGMRQVGKSTLLPRQPELARRRYVSHDDFAHQEAARRHPEAFLADLIRLRAFLAATPGCRAAILTHQGTAALRLGDRLRAVPLSLVLS